jgi:hypothetical protein
MFLLSIPISNNHNQVFVKGHLLVTTSLVIFLASMVGPNLNSAIGAQDYSKSSPTNRYTIFEDNDVDRDYQAHSK